jgi:hypothetical protein
VQPNTPTADSSALSKATESLTKQLSAASKQLLDTTKQISNTWASIAAGSARAPGTNKPTKSPPQQNQRRQSPPNRRPSVDHDGFDVVVEVTEQRSSERDLLAHLVETGALSASTVKSFARDN